jgi:hypothetical protein
MPNRHFTDNQTIFLPFKGAKKYKILTSDNDLLVNLFTLSTINVHDTPWQLNAQMYNKEYLDPEFLCDVSEIYKDRFSERAVAPNVTCSSKTTRAKYN